MRMKLGEPYLLAQGLDDLEDFSHQTRLHPRLGRMIHCDTL